VVVHTEAEPEYFLEIFESENIDVRVHTLHRRSDWRLPFVGRPFGLRS
jgi:hypothetical protein